MRATTLTTADGSLLAGVRSVLADAEEALLCVAFASEAGVHLLHEELKGLRERARLLVTTQFGTTSGAALSRASSLGVQVRVLNPAGSRTYHPKLYIGRAGNSVAAVIGSANLTAGLVSNIEVACRLDGNAKDAALHEAWSRGREWWDATIAHPWIGAVAEASPEPDWGADPALFEMVKGEVRRNPVFQTLGREPRKNVAVSVAPEGIYVETARSRGTGTGAQLVPSWMIALAWDYLRAHGTLTNRHLLDVLLVHRSSFVCALLARLPGVNVGSGTRIALEWRPAIA